MADGVVMEGGSVQGDFGDGCVFVGVIIRSLSRFGKGCVFENCVFECGAWYHPYFSRFWTIVGEASVMHGGSVRCADWSAKDTIWSGVANGGANRPAQMIDVPPRSSIGGAINTQGTQYGQVVGGGQTTKDCALQTKLTDCTTGGTVKHGEGADVTTSGKTV